LGIFAQKSPVRVAELIDLGLQDIMHRCAFSSCLLHLAVPVLVARCALSRPQKPLARMRRCAHPWEAQLWARRPYVYREALRAHAAVPVLPHRRNQFAGGRASLERRHSCTQKTPEKNYPDQIKTVDCHPCPAHATRCRFAPKNMFGMARNWSDHDAKEPASGPRVRSTEAGGKGKVRVALS